MTHSFVPRVKACIASKGNPCVVGLDPDFALMPTWIQRTYANDHVTGITKYCRLVLETVSPIVPIVKPQAAYFEVYGSDGIAVLEELSGFAKELGLMVLLDAKRGDIDSTSRAYAEAYFSGRPGSLDVDAMTINPYLGFDSVLPFCEAAAERGKGVFICALTSNSGAKTLQMLVADGKPVYQHVADLVLEIQDLLEPGVDESFIGVVCGSTYPEEAIALRALLPRSTFLVPGIGAQGGNENLLNNFFVSNRTGAIVSSSRSIMYPKDADSSEESVSDIVSATLRFVEAVNGGQLAQD